MALSGFCAALGVPSGASAAEFPLVPGARWVVATESMAQVDGELVPLLAKAGRRASFLSPKSQAREREEAWGLPVLDLARWKDAGLDPAQGWVLFANDEGTWLSAGVVDAGKVAAWLDRWARLRGLLLREVVSPGGGSPALDTVTYARAKGSRVAAARVLSSSRVLVLTKSDVRGVALGEAFRRIENVVPASAPVEGVLRGWMRRASARNVWWSVRPQSGGVDVDLRFGGVEPGWVQVEPARAAWVTAALEGRGAAFRGRAMVGPAWASYAADELAEGFRVDDGAWTEALATAAVGPVEWVGETVYPARAVVRRGEVEWARVFPSWFLLPDRPSSSVSAFLESSAAAWGAPRRGSGPFRPVVVEAGWKGRVESGEGASSARLAIGETTLPAPRSGQSSTPFGDGCARGHPVAAGRVDALLLARALDGVSLLGALRDEAVMAAWAIGSELGPLLRVSEPLTGIACAEVDDAVEARLRWRFRP